LISVVLEYRKGKMGDVIVSDDGIILKLIVGVCVCVCVCVCKGHDVNSVQLAQDMAQWQKVTKFQVSWKHEMYWTDT
jgi:hypothetical protein